MDHPETGAVPTTPKKSKATRHTRKAEPNPLSTTTKTAESKAIKPKSKPDPNVSSTPTTTAESKTTNRSGQPKPTGKASAPADSGNAGTTPAVKARQHSERRRRAPQPVKPKTSQTGPLVPATKEQRPPLVAARAAQRRPANRKPVKVPATQPVTQTEFEAREEDVGIDPSMTAKGKHCDGEDAAPSLAKNSTPPPPSQGTTSLKIGNPFFMVVDGKPYDGRRAAAFLASKVKDPAEILRAKMDRRWGYPLAKDTPGASQPASPARKRSTQPGSLELGVATAVPFPERSPCQTHSEATSHEVRSSPAPIASEEQSIIVLEETVQTEEKNVAPADVDRPPTADDDLVSSATPEISSDSLNTTSGEDTQQPDLGSEEQAASSIVESVLVPATDSETSTYADYAPASTSSPSVPAPSVTASADPARDATRAPEPAGDGVLLPSSLPEEEQPDDREHVDASRARDSSLMIDTSGTTPDGRSEVLQAQKLPGNPRHASPARKRSTPPESCDLDVSAAALSPDPLPCQTHPDALELRSPPPNNAAEEQFTIVPEDAVRAENETVASADVDCRPTADDDCVSSAVDEVYTDSVCTTSGKDTEQPDLGTDEKAASSVVESLLAPATDSETFTYSNHTPASTPSTSVLAPSLAASSDPAEDVIQAAEGVGISSSVPEDKQPYNRERVDAFFARNPSLVTGTGGATPDGLSEILQAQNLSDDPPPYSPARKKLSRKEKKAAASTRDDSSTSSRPAVEPVYPWIQPVLTIGPAHQPIHLWSQPQILAYGTALKPIYQLVYPRNQPQVLAHSPAYEPVYTWSQPQALAYAQVLPPLKPAPPRFDVAKIAGTRFQSPATNVQEVMKMLASIPNPWPPTTQSFPSAYLYTMTHEDPRSEIPPLLLDPARHSALSISILKSWQASEPSADSKYAVVRILNQVNAVLQERYGQWWNFAIEPFGSVSWGGETGDTADVDMTLKVG
jgi:hypothetical protein